nr:YggS family pyridoxal phosphate-dependent enzyme [Rubrobacter indicoceani]
MIGVSSDLLRERLHGVGEEIARASERSGRRTEEVKLLVASKYYDADQMKALKEAGVKLVGENRAEELSEKQARFGADFEWHFIGHLQRRKVKDVISHVENIQSVDSIRLVKEIAKRAENPAKVLLQVNVSGEEAKYGVAEAEVEELLEAAAGTGGKVDVAGFMTIAPAVERASDVRYVFARLREVRERLRQSWSPHFDLSELSMGMSSDYAVAVEEGSTIVRIGRVLIEEGEPAVRRRT